MADPGVVAQALLDLFSAIQLRGGSEHFERLEAEGLSLTQYKALSILSRSATVLSVKDLAAQLAVSAPATSRAVDGLVNRGWVERSEGDRDRRQRSLRINEAGQQVVRELDKLRLADWEEFLREFDTETLRTLHAAVLPIVTSQK